MVPCVSSPGGSLSRASRPLTGAAAAPAASVRPLILRVRVVPVLPLVPRLNATSFLVTSGGDHFNLHCSIKCVMHTSKSKHESHVPACAKRKCFIYVLEAVAKVLQPTQ